MDKKTVLVGAGALGREILFLLREAAKTSPGFDLLGFVDDTPELQGKTVHGLPVLGPIRWLEKQTRPLNAILCLGAPAARKAVAGRLLHNPALDFPSFIAPNVICSDTARFGKGCIVCCSSIVTVDVRLGDFVFVYFDCTVAHDARLADYVTLYSSINVNGYVEIGEGTEVGAGCQLNPHVQVGGGCVIGAGAVVTRDIPANCTAVGVPARVIKP